MRKRKPPPPLLVYIRAHRLRERALARLGDPDTSQAAAKSLHGETLARLHEYVCTTLAAHPGGLTTFEIAALGGVGRDSISPRMKALTERRLVADSGERRIPAGRSRAAIVWKLTAAPELANG